jgi:hypothetical protein
MAIYPWAGEGFADAHCGCGVREEVRKRDGHVRWKMCGVQTVREAGGRWDDGTRTLLKACSEYLSKLS